MLAQTLYWGGAIKEAEAVYEAGLAQHPDDTRLRLEFARMLMETQRAARARVLLTPLRDDKQAASEAESLLGTMAYWEGDLSAAKRHFESALRHTPEQAEATRQLEEIQALAAPWVRFAGEFRHDDQPLDRLAGSAEAGWYLTPLHSIAVRVQPQRLTSSELGETLLAGEAALGGFWPAARLETEAAVGVLQRSSTREPQLTGKLGLGLRLPQNFTVRARAERAPYLWTRASLVTPVMTDAFTGLLDWNDPRGWLGQAGYVLQQYPDRNRIHTTYVWALAPVVRSGPAEVKLGYGLNYQDAEQNRFVLAGGSLAGRYQPYYTPQDLQVHSATGALTLQAKQALVLRTSGAYGVYAAENAPVFLQPEPAPPQASEISYCRRTFHPWNARAALTAALPNRLAATVFGEHFRTAFYAYSGAGIDLTYRFGPSGRRQ
jgi:tetratricopeptide (TPR) repeat protein